MALADRHYLGVEIGGTKLQVGVGPSDGLLRGLWRGGVDPAAGPAGIRRQLIAAVPEVLGRAGLRREQLGGVGIGFGGPVEDATRTVIKSHQIAGWDGFPLADWIGEAVGLPTALGNDADVAGLGEALHGAGKGLTPIFYVTIGSGIGGGLILDGKIYRGVGRGAAEIGHLLIEDDGDLRTVEELASGWGMEERYHRFTGLPRVALPEIVRRADDPNPEDEHATRVFARAIDALGEALCQAIALLCPRRIVIGGGVALLGDRLLGPLRARVERLVFAPFGGLTDIVPAALGEEVVVHGAIGLARQQLG